MLPTRVTDPTLVKQMANQGFIERFWENLNKIGREKITQPYLKARLSLLESYWDSFKERHYALLTTDAADVKEYLTKDTFQATEDTYVATKARITATLDGPPKQDTSAAVPKHIQLPKIDLPTFSGDQLAWESFRDLFRSLVGDVAELAAVQKLQYLKACLTGEAAAVVANLQLTEQGYATAWADLSARYDNKRVLLSAHMRAFLNSVAVTKASSTELKRLMTTALQSRRSFASLGRPVDHWDDWFVHIIVEKLDSSSRLNWESSLQTSSEFPTFERLQDFVQTRIRALDAALPRSSAAPNPVSNSKTQGRKVTTLTACVAGAPGTPRRCPMCQGNHLFSYCARFKALHAAQRREYVKKLGACFNCLKMKHTVSNCPSGVRCLHCQDKHHTLLHIAGSTPAAETPDTNTPASVPTTPKDTTASPQVTANLAALATAAGRSVLLTTAQVVLSNDQGDRATVRALLDSGSEATFVSERVARTLRLTRRRVGVPVAGIQGTFTGVAAHAVSVNLSSPRPSDLHLRLTEALVLPKLTSAVPQCRVARLNWPHLEGLPLADPRFDDPAPVDVILGADVYGALLREGLRKGPPGTPSAQLTALGWVLMGRVVGPSPALPRRSVTVHHSTTGDHDLSRVLRRFWELEELPTKPIPSEEDAHCEAVFAASHRRDSSGRYVVQLPRRENPRARLSGNRGEALSQLLSLERRLSRDARLREQYTTFMSEYLALGHMGQIPAEDVSRRDAYYLPHHAVFKVSDREKKIRVVFNASFRTTSGWSLNDTLLPGPKLQSELWMVLSRWRLYRYAFSTDIVKMFRQILICPEDTHLQRILWRSDPTAEVQDFRLLTVVYGTAPAPYLALRTLLQLATDEGRNFPLGSAAIRNHSYVDDILAGGHTLERALETQRQLVALLAAGGFELSKWASNVPQLCPAGTPSPRMFHDREGIATLGVLWKPTDDTFTLRATPTPAVGSRTKRAVLSEVARFFDPLGWASPVLVFGKIFIQDLWMSGVDWDQPLSDQLQTSWSNFVEGLPRLDQVTVPRWLGYRDNGGSVELHGFSDASSRAYAAAVYLRCTDPAGNVSVQLLVDKTRVAPVKPVSIPRLELCGALLTARLLRATAEGLCLTDAPTYAWTDARVVLSWIRSHPSRWKPFVANRVAELQELVPPHSWRYVTTTDNPADAATRGISPDELRELDLWWSGPSWLNNPQYAIPGPEPDVPGAEEEEMRLVATHVAQPSEDHPVLTRFSSLSRLLRVTALCIRFCHNAGNPQDRQTGFITRADLEAARRRWVQLAQLADFADEIAQLEQSRPLPARSPLLPLRPFLDRNGLLRVGGRLQRALLPYSEKHPLILARSNRLSLLLVRDAHASTLHGGPQLTRSFLLRRVWILQASSLVKDVVHKCVRCARFRAVAAEQQMGQLPAERTRPARPFLSAGLDYAGPISLRTTKGRGHKTIKGYICLFVCLSTKAIHLEAVSDLTTASFLAAFKRFTARRGHCQHLVSDNGTNFRGASHEIRAMFKAANDFYTECAANLANLGTDWSFIPPGAPHFGGLWEAGVRSVKYHLRRIIGEHALTYEEMSTLLTQVEACLNSRPLHALSTDPSDLAALTPGHLLIGEPLINVPEPSLLDVEQRSLSSRWAMISSMRDHFWKRWSTEYVHHLQQLTRWKRVRPNLAVGDLVLLRNELQPPARWALARIAALHPGPDGLVRVVTLRTTSAVLKRPITKVCPLPIETAPGVDTEDNAD